MTKRKPPNVSFPDWVEQQIRSAEAAGAFDNLPGAGKPIPGLDRPRNEMSWVADYLRRENIDAASLLPPGLALAKEVEVLPERLQREHSEREVRILIEDLNERIRRAHRLPQVGPPVRVGTVDVERAVARWSEQRALIENQRREASAAAAAPPETARPRRWFKGRPQRSTASAQPRPE